MKFTTRDQDNDHCDCNCAIPAHSSRSGGWWFNQCANIFPNSQYNYKYGILLNGQWHSLPFMEIKIRLKTAPNI